MHLRIFLCFWQGIHLDPSIYLMDDENKLSMKTQPKVEKAEVASDSLADDSTCQMQNQPADDVKLDPGSRSLCTENTSSEEHVSCDQTHDVLRNLASVNIEDGVSADKGLAQKFQYLSLFCFIEVREQN